ncbi:MAG TPA: nitrogenase [Cyanobacteria bacterium UBA8156]|jgi:tellurite resistance protein|nr:nitrogenase [Cyanobacteria bacterium UBA8156]
MNAESYTHDQIAVWLRGLAQIARADGHFSREEEELIRAFADHSPGFMPAIAPAMAPVITPGDGGLGEGSPEESGDCPNFEAQALPPVTVEELAAVLGKGTTVAESFLRTAVAIALVDGEYSDAEDRLIQQYAQALACEADIMNQIRLHLENRPEAHPDVLAPLKSWLDGVAIHDPRIARTLCRLIPSQCPFERDIVLFGKKVAHIPAMCKINPLYDQLMGLRFRALSYLADECHEDVSEFC